jgi:hypothetical protein
MPCTVKPPTQSALRENSSSILFAPSLGAVLCEAWTAPGCHSKIVREVSSRLNRARPDRVLR